jgi:hypothetical protein
MQKVNSKTIAVLYDHVLRLTENVSPVLNTVFNTEPKGLLNEILQDTQHDLMEGVFKHKHFWMNVPHAGLVRVDQILPSGTVCCFRAQSVSNTTASAIAIGDFDTWVMSKTQSNKLDAITKWMNFTVGDLEYATYGGETSKLTLCDPANTDQIWVRFIIEYPTHAGTVRSAYVTRYAGLALLASKNTSSDSELNDVLKTTLETELFNNSGVMSVVEVELLRAVTTVEVSPWSFK